MTCRPCAARWRRRCADALRPLARPTAPARDLTGGGGGASGYGEPVRRTIEVSGPASVTEVWQRYAVISAWPSWSPPIRAVEASAPRIAPGVTGIVRGVAGVFITFRIESVDERRHTWSWRVGFGPLTALLEHGVRLTDGDAGCVTTLTVDAVPPIALGYPEVARLSLHRLVAPAS